MIESAAAAPVAVTLRLADPSAPILVERRGSRIAATSGDRPLLSLHRDEAGRADDPAFAVDGATGDPVAATRALAAVAEAVFGWEPERASLRLALDPDEPLARHLVAHGLARVEAGILCIRPETAMQRRDPWLADPDRPPYPLDLIMTGDRRHPRRPRKPEGLVYARHIPWLGEAVSFRALTLADLPLFHRWMNDERVAAIWSETGSEAEHRAYLSALIADPHMLPLIGCFGDRPFGYFEIYWAKENRIAPFYDAGDYDRGWHVAVGEDAFRGRAYISAWLPSLMHYLFLDDPRTERIVGEPAASHAQQIRNLDVSGFAKLKTFSFPHKRAMLVMLLRERFFGDRLWRPAARAEGGR